MDGISGFSQPPWDARLVLSHFTGEGVVGGLSSGRARLALVEGRPHG